MRDADAAAVDASLSDDLSQLALLYNMLGAHDKALTLLHKRLVIHEKFGPDEMTGETLQALGTTYRLLGLNDLAQQHLERALVVREGCHGQASSKVAETLNSLSLLNQQRNETAKGEALQLRSLQVLLECSEPEDIESEDVPWEVFKRLKQQRGPSTADNSVKLYKETMRKCVVDALSEPQGPDEGDALMDETEERRSSSFFGAELALEQHPHSQPQSKSPSQTQQRHPPQDAHPFEDHAPSLSKENRSQSESAMVRLRVERAAVDDIERRLSVTREDGMGGNELEQRNSTSASQLLSSGHWDKASLSGHVYQSINDLTTLQHRVEAVKRKVQAGSPDVDIEIARLASDIDLISQNDLKQIGATMISLVREMHRMCVRSDRARQLPPLEGMLEKKSASIFRGWEKRWFKVDPKTFVVSYHFSKDDYSRGFAPRGGFPVARISSIIVHRQTRGSFFQFDVVVDLSTRLSPHAARTYELRSENEETVRFWVETLHYYKAMAQASLASGAPPAFARPSTS